MRLFKHKINILWLSLGIFGLTWLSIASVSALTANTTISSVISPVISVLTTNGTVNVNIPAPTGSGVQTIASDTVTVSTNDSNGYTLSLADSSASTAALISGSNTIPASSGTQSSPATQSVNTWGYCVSGVGGFSTNCPSSSASDQSISGSYTFAGVPLSGSPNTIATTSTTASNATTTVWYAVAANTSQATGTYTTTVTYTAVTN